MATATRAPVSGIYAVTNPARKTCWVGQSTNALARVASHLRNGQYGEQFTNWRMLEKIPIDEWDQDYVGDAETNWMNTLEKRGWRLINRSRACNPFGGTGPHRDAITQKAIATRSKNAGWREATGRAAAQNIKQWKTRDPEAWLAHQSQAGKAAKQVPSKTAQVLGGRVQGPRTMAMRRCCNECDMISTPTGIATHQKASGHTGWTKVVV